MTNIEIRPDPLGVQGGRSPFPRYARRCSACKREPEWCVHH